MRLRWWILVGCSLETDIHRFKMQEDDLEDLRAKNSRLQASLRDRENALIDAQSEKEEALRGKVCL